MIRHYLTFQHQAELLDEPLHGWVLAECWSQEKNRLVLRFIMGRESAFVEISVDLRVGYVLPASEIHRARKNTIDFFHALLGATLDHVAMDESERVIRFRFVDGRELAAIFFGRGSGNVLLLKGGEIVESFQEVEDEYAKVLEPEEEDILTRTTLIERLRTSGRSPARALTGVLPGLGKRLAEEAVRRAGLQELESVADASASDLTILLDTVDALFEECRVSTVFRLYHTPDDVIFSLTSLQGIEQGEVEKIEEFDDLPRAIRAYRGTLFRKEGYDRLKGRMLKHLEKEIGRLERSLEHAGRPEQHLQRGEEWERMGNVMLANLHLVRKGEPEALLVDWEGNELKVKLDPKLTPAENADRYFRKARGARIEVEHAEHRAATMRERLSRLARLRQLIEGLESVGELEAIQERNNDIFRMKGEAKEKGSPERFRKFVVAGGHEVYAGKNAANNDELTLRFARPNDIWMHARGTSGSHVVLRWNDQKERPPKRTLEEAAMVAAYYSGAKNSRLVPVAWTFKKYVRKPKGAAPGAVMVGREDVLMVEPRLPEGSADQE